MPTVIYGIRVKVTGKFILVFQYDVKKVTFVMDSGEGVDVCVQIHVEIRRMCNCANGAVHVDDIEPPSTHIQMAPVQCTLKVN